MSKRFRSDKQRKAVMAKINAGRAGRMAPKPHNRYSPNRPLSCGHFASSYTHRKGGGVSVTCDKCGTKYNFDGVTMMPREPSKKEREDTEVLAEWLAADLLPPAYRAEAQEALEDKNTAWAHAIVDELRASGLAPEE